MSKDSKRYRQISIRESFSLSKKSKHCPHSSTMEQNLRDLLAASAEKRIEATKMETNQAKTAECASTSNFKVNEENVEVPDSDDIYVPSSQELFQDSEEIILPTQSVTEIPPTPENELTSLETISDFTRSAELFPDTIDSKREAMSESESDSENEQVAFLNRIPRCSISLPKLEPLENHSIMFSPHIRPGDAPRPYPNTNRDIWDFNHVRMPCSLQNKYPVEDANGEKQIKSRWHLICYSLQRNIETSRQLEAAIMRYNSQYKDKWNFIALHAFFDQHLSNEEQVHFFESILPKMIKMALDLPNICTQPPPLLRKNKDYYVTLSQKQIGCLLLNAFFCTFPRRNNYSKYRREKFTDEYSSFPDINFNRLYFGVKNRISSSRAEKLKCLLNYFRRITSEVPSGTVTFHRQFLENLPKWEDSVRGIKTAVIKSDGLIESEGYGMLQVDFANKFMGGGVLGDGCVQEEIRFVICPELIVSRLLVECLGPTEVLIITGVEQYNKYSGYSNTFKWEGNFYDQTRRDDWGRRCTQLVAMDALHFHNTCEQYKDFRIKRELNKAFCGFYEDAIPANLSAVATGNWGCGAYNGNPVMKFIIQLMAASQAGRDMLYFTFGNQTLKRELQNIYEIFTEQNLAVGDVWKILIRYFNTARMSRQEPFPTLYRFICSIFVEKENNIPESKCLNQDTQVISSSEQAALEKLIEDVNENSDTEIEDNSNAIMDDPG